MKEVDPFNIKWGELLKDSLKKGKSIIDMNHILRRVHVDIDKCFPLSRNLS